MSNRPSAPLWATINVTGLCNLNCKYCYFQPRSNEHMSWRDFRRIVSELSDMKVFYINLSGGEPFIHPEIDRFLRFIHSKFRHVLVLTNGTILKPRHIEAVTDIVEMKGSFSVQVSIDSVSPQINRKTRSGVSKILRNIRTLSQIGAEIVIAMVVSRFNACSVVKSISELSQYTKYFHLMTVQEVKALNGADKDYTLEESELTQLWKEVRSLEKELGLQMNMPDECSDLELGCAFGAPCMAGFSHIVIDPSLKVRPCDRCVEAFIGDLNNETIEEVWKGQAVRQVLDGPIPFCQRTDQTISTG